MRPGALIFVLVAGPPGSGKTTLARPLANELGLPLIAKDDVKEALMDSLGAPTTIEESRHLGEAAVMAMLAVARTSLGAVLDSTFYPYAVPHLKALPGVIVEIRCRCPPEMALARYRTRAAGRHPGHLDANRSIEELTNEQHLKPLGLGPLIEVDTSTEVDIPSLAQQVAAVASSANAAG